LRRSPGLRGGAVACALLAAATAEARRHGPRRPVPVSGAVVEQRGITKAVTRAPLPGGLVLEAEPNSFRVRRDALVAPLEPFGPRVVPMALDSVDVDTDGRAAIATVADACDDRRTVTLPLAALNARLENVAALALHRQRKFEAAAEGFSRALTLDPTLDVAATNRASAELKAGKPDDALRTLGPLLARAPIATYAQVASDPELVPLLRRPALAALRAPAPGKARLTLAKNDVTMGGKTTGEIAVSSRHRLVAAVDDAWSWAICVGEADLVLFDANGAEVKRMPLFSTDDMSNDEARACPFKPAAKPRIAARVAAAQRVLTDLGFSIASGRDEAVVSTTEAGRPKASFPRAKLGLVLGTDRVRILRGDDERGSAPSAGGEAIERVDHLPELGVVVLRWARGAREGCESLDPAGIQVIPFQP
jgi:tetratricopeptide (TPR) repeat protein